MLERKPDLLDLPRQRQRENARSRSESKGGTAPDRWQEGSIPGEVQTDAPLLTSAERLTRDRMFRTMSATVVFALLLLLLVGLAALIGPPIAAQGSRLAERLPHLMRDPKVFERLLLPDWMAPIASARKTLELRSRSALEATGSIP